MYGIYIYTNIGGILMVNVTIYSIHGSYGLGNYPKMFRGPRGGQTLGSRQDVFVSFQHFMDTLQLLEPPAGKAGDEKWMIFMRM